MKKFYSVELESNAYRDDTFSSESYEDCIKYLRDNDYTMAEGNRVAVWEWDGNMEYFTEGECVDIITEWEV